MNTFKKKFLGGVAAGAAALALSACLLPVGDGVGLDENNNVLPAVPPDTNLAFVFENAIKPANCKNCHSSPSHESGISFMSLPATFNAFFTADSQPKLTNLLKTTHPTHLIQKGSLDSSYLWHKIDPNGHATLKNGAKMPIPGVGSVLTNQHIAIIRAWILRGAPIQ